MTTIASRSVALAQVLGRYKAVTVAAWKMRKELAGPSRLADEYAFLPAALSIQETPVHPAPRRAMWVIVAIFTAALVWSVVGKVDIVAVAPGQIAVGDRTKVIQPLEAAVVRSIRVKDGDHVVAGQALLELDATSTNADIRSLQEQLRATRSERARSIALVASLRSNVRPDASALDASAARMLNSEWQDIRAKLSKMDAEIAHRDAERITARQLLTKLQTTLPLAQQRETDIRQLSEQGFVSSHAGQDRTRERIELEKDLQTQVARVAEAEAGLTESRSTRAAYLAEATRTLGDREEQATVKEAQLSEELAKSEQKRRLLRLDAPIDGMVQQLAIHTVGGVVTAAQQLMVIVPDQQDVVAEVMIANKDIGFVKVGQHVEIKLETFNFTKYGTIPAEVIRVTADAVNDEKRGAIFPATLRLKRKAIDIDGKIFQLPPGLTIVAEVTTGERHVIEYLFAPLQKRVHESLGER